MTVAELITELAKHPANAEVRIPAGFPEYVGDTTDFFVRSGLGLQDKKSYNIVFIEP